MKSSVRVLFQVLYGSVALLLLCAAPAYAVGEAVGGFPNWNERVIHEWMNRARADPQVEMTACGTNCADKACYTPIAPLAYVTALSHASRFHSDEMLQQSYFAHDSMCNVVANINTLYPGSCNGAASCACVGGTKTCSGACTAWFQRVPLFGPNPSGEIIASSNDPNSAFYQWLFESYPGTTCAYDQGPPTNGHRWNILKSTGGVGVGVSGTTGSAVGDFGSGPATGQIPSGSHYPRQAASVDVWANWYDTAGGPTSALVDVDGTCTPLTMKRGSATNGAWSATLTGFASGCHRYFFIFKDKTGTTVTYPTSGSLAIGPAASCPDYDTTRPPTGTGCGVSLPEDGGVNPMDDAGGGGGGSTDDGGTDNSGGGSTPSGCSCQLGAGAPVLPNAATPLALSFLALLGIRRRRR